MILLWIFFKSFARNFFQIILIGTITMELVIPGEHELSCFLCYFYSCFGFFIRHQFVGRVIPFINSHLPSSLVEEFTMLRKWLSQNRVAVFSSDCGLVLGPEVLSLAFSWFMRSSPRSGWIFCRVLSFYSELWNIVHLWALPKDSSGFLIVFSAPSVQAPHTSRNVLY